MSLTEDKLNRLLNELSFDANGLIPPSRSSMIVAKY